MNQPPPSFASAGARKPRLLWLAMFGVFIALAAIIWFVGLRDIASIEALQARRDELIARVDAAPALSIAAYMGVYALATLALTPGTLWLTLLAGFLFGPLIGVPATVFAGSIGAFGVFWIARSSLRPWIERHAGPAVRRFEAGFREDALSYMFALRFMPIAPYPVANLVPSLLGASFGQFALTTVIGLIPSVTAYSLMGHAVGAAVDAGRTQSLTGLAADFAPALIALGVIALSPVAYKRWRRNHIRGDGGGA